MMSDISADTRSTSRPTSRPTLDRHLGRYSADTGPTYSTDISAETRPTLSRYLGRYSGERSTDTWSSVGRQVFQVGRPRPSVATIGRYLVGLSDYTRPTPRPLRTLRWAISRPILDQHLDRHLSRYSIKMSADTRLIFDRHTRPTSRPRLDRHSADISADTRARYRQTLRQVSVDMFLKLVGHQSPLSVNSWSVCRITLGRYLGRYSTDISTDTRARYRPTLVRESAEMSVEYVGRVSGDCDR